MYKVLKSKTFVVVILNISIALFSCDGDDNKHTMNGLWYCILSDSSYAEVYFTDSNYLFYHNDFHRYFTYKVKGNTLSLIDNGKERDFQLKFNGQNEVSLVSTDSAPIKYFRVKDQKLDDRKYELLMKGDEDTLEEYRHYFEARMLEKIGP